MHEKKLLGVISFCVNNSIAVDRIRILRSNKVYFFDNYISSNRFICNIIAKKIIKVLRGRQIGMKCPYCGEEMIRGYLMSSRDITFAVDNPIKVFRIKKSNDLELSKGSGGIPHCEAYRCSSCKKILIDYANR